MTKLRRFLFLRPAEAKTTPTNDEQVVFEEQVRLSMVNHQANIRKINMLGQQVADLTAAVLELRDNGASKTTKAPKAD